MRLRPSHVAALAVALWGADPVCSSRAGEAMDPRPLPVAEGPPIQAVTLDAREVPPPGTLERLADLGVTHVTLITFAFQPRYDVPEVRMHTDGGWFSESDRGIRALAAEARALGMGLIIKPHIWLGGWSAEGQERHAVGFETEAGWAAWEAGYRRFILHYAALAEEVEAALFCIGTELAGPARARPEFWRGLAADVRAVYGGPLTYAANWWEEYEHVEFWDALDYVGVQAYFPLSDADAPTLEGVREGWSRHREALMRVARAAGRPILFTEIGYRSVPYAAAEPWRWPSREEVGRVEPDPQLQAQLYEGFFEAVWEEPWFAGAILWKWYPGPPRPDRAGRRALDFTPQDKPAEGVIRQWFSRVPPPIEAGVDG